MTDPSNSSNAGSFDWNQGVFQLGDDALRGFVQVQTTKEAAKGFYKAPPASIGIIVGGGLLLVLLLVMATKK